MVRLASILFLLCAQLCLSAGADVRAIYVAGDSELTRLTIETDLGTDGAVYLSQANDLPLIEFVSNNTALREAAYLGEPTGGVAAYTLDDDRISFELNTPMMVMRELSPPPLEGETTRRYIIDLTRVSEARFAAAARRDAKPLRLALEARTESQAIVPPATTEAEAPPPSIKPWGLDAVVTLARVEKKVIVIDPGHGGRDPGTSSIVGGQEKDIVLAASKRLQALLEEDPRYIVYLTRASDIYVEHEDRVSKARDWGADLFISIHVDASGAPTTNGASVYSIDSRGERRKDGAAKVNGWHLETGNVASKAVENILEDLIKRETKSNSAIFAEMVLPQLAEAGPLLKNPNRRENLAVLLAPDVPAVLIELGFITNKADAKRLKSTAGQTDAAVAIKQAIDDYFDRQDLILAAN